MPAYWIEETDQDVGTNPIDMITRFMWRAELRRSKLQRELNDNMTTSYRWVVERVHEGSKSRWAVTAKQNVLHYSSGTNG